MAKKVFNIIWAILIIIAIGVGIYCGIMIYNAQKEYKEVEDTNDEIISLYTKNTSEDDTEEFSVDWESLLNINSEIVAWIRIPNTNVNYPIVQSDNNNQYLRRNIYGNYSYGGCIFVDSAIESPFNTGNTIIYGHNLNNGSMFSNLKKYKDEDYAVTHKDIYIYLSNGEQKQYKIFSFTKVKENNYDIYNNSVDDLDAYYEIISKYNQLPLDENIDNTKPILTLSTCTNGNKQDRYVIQAYLV